MTVNWDKALASTFGRVGKSSTLLAWTLSSKLIPSRRSAYVQTQEIQPRIQAKNIELVLRSKAICRQSAMEVGVVLNLLTRWVREAQPGPEKVFSGTGSTRDKELARLKRKLT